MATVLRPVGLLALTCSFAVVVAFGRNHRVDDLDGADPHPAGIVMSLAWHKRVSRCYDSVSTERWKSHSMKDHNCGACVARSHIDCRIVTSCRFSDKGKFYGDCGC